MPIHTSRLTTFHITVNMTYAKATYHKLHFLLTREKSAFHKLFDEVII